MNVQSDWWDHFFEGVSVDLWLWALPPEETRREADVLEGALAVPSGAELLDVPCGGGRLSLALAERGYRITGVDWSSEFLDHARSCSGSDRVSWERRDMRDLPWRSRFDGAFCVGNSFGYLDDEGNAAFLRAVCAALKPGARFVLETPMVLENLLRHLHDRSWWKVGDMYLLVSNHYDPTLERLEIEYTFVSNGRVEVRHGSHRAYAYRQLVELMDDCGFAVEPAVPWTREAHAVLFIATRR
jgi:SAM-dependent methyltransferase